MTPTEIRRAIDYNGREFAAGRLTRLHVRRVCGWSSPVEERWDWSAITHAIGRYQAEQGLACDCKAGPRTRARIDGELARVRTWTPTVDPIPVGWAAALEVYGDPHAVDDPADPRLLKVSSEWESANMRTISASLIPGYGRRIYMHRLVAPHFLEAMTRARAACPTYKVTKIGCFNPRRIRFAPGARPSDHTLGIAFDINDDTNHWAPAGAIPFAAGWRKWSDMPKAFVEAFESVGFDWGGLWDGGGDCMHFSLRTIR